MLPVNNSSSGNSSGELAYHFEFFALSAVPLITVFGNVLVVVAVMRERHLKTSTNFLLVSLAIADLLVAVCVMPFSIYLLICDLKWYLPDVWCHLFIVGDVGASTASIVHLMAVSIDRCFAVLKHLDYHAQRHRKLIYISIALCWLFSIGLALPLGIGLNPGQRTLLHRCGIENPYFMLYGSLFAFYIPCLIMMIMYGFVFRQLRQRFQAVKLQEMAAGNIASFGLNLEEVMAAAHGGIHNIRRNTLNWAMPFAQTVERGSDSDADSVSSDDIDELTSILYQIESGVTAKGSGDGDGLVLRNRRMPGLWRRRRSRWTESARRRMSTLSVRFSERRKQSINMATDQARRLKTRAVDLFTRIRCAQGRVIRKEAKATRLVSTVLVAFLMCWLPFFSINVVRAYMLWYATDRWTRGWDIFFTFCTWLGYLNSCLNPIIYTLINRRFRASFMRTLNCGPEPDASERRKQKCEQMRLLQQKGMQQRLININAPLGDTEIKIARKSSETNNSSDRYFSTDGVDLQEVRLQQQDTFL